MSLHITQKHEAFVPLVTSVKNLPVTVRGYGTGALGSMFPYQTLIPLRDAPRAWLVPGGYSTMETWDTKTIKGLEPQAHFDHPQGPYNTFKVLFGNVLLARHQDWAKALPKEILEKEKCCLHFNLRGRLTHDGAVGEDYYRPYLYDEERPFEGHRLLRFGKMMVTGPDEQGKYVITPGVTVKLLMSEGFPGLHYTAVQSKIRDGTYDNPNYGSRFKFIYDCSFGISDGFFAHILLAAGERQVGNDWLIDWHRILFSARAVRNHVDVLTGEYYDLDDLFSIESELVNFRVIHDYPHNTDTDGPLNRTSVEDIMDTMDEIPLGGELIPDAGSPEFYQIHFARPPVPGTGGPRDVEDFLEEDLGWSSRRGYFTNSSIINFLSYHKMTKNATFPLSEGGIGLAAQEATEAMIKTATANYVESLAELDGLLDLIDFPLSLAKFLKQPNKGFFSFVKKLADINLSMQFGFAPTIQDAQALIPVAQRLVASLEQNLKPIEARGSAMFNNVAMPEGYISALPHNFRFNAKVVGIVQYDNLWLKIFMRLNEVGLAPTPGNFYALSRLSWLISGFLPLGKSLEMAERMVRTLLIDTKYAVTTTTIDLPFPREILVGRNLRAENITEKPGLRFLLRDVHRTIPPLGPMSLLPIVNFRIGLPVNILGSFLAVSL